jgi:hypothetical protein
MFLAASAHAEDLRPGVLILYPFLRSFPLNRGLLEAEFDTVFMVATEAALLEGAGRLNPVVVVVDLSLSAGDLSGLLRRIGTRARGEVVAPFRARPRHGRRLCAGRRCRRGSAETLLGYRPDARSQCRARGQTLSVVGKLEMKRIGLPVRMPITRKGTC